MDLPDDNNKPRPSRLADGFNRIARDFDRAVRLARFDPLQAFLVGEARELSWTSSQIDGTNEPRPFRFNLSELARLLGCSRSWLSAQCRELVALRVLIESDGGDLLINKDYRDWLVRIKIAGVDRLAPRFTDLQLEWCLKAKRRARGVRRTGQSDAPEGVLCARQKVTTGAVDRTPPVLRTGHPLSCAPDTPEQSTRHPRPESLEVAHKERAPAPAELLRESRESLESGESIYIPTEPAPKLHLESQPGRSTDELALIHEACRILGSTLETEKVGLDLLRTHNSPDLIGLEGWRFVRAANRQIRATVPASAKRSLAYFVTTARNLDQSERDAPAEADRPRLTRRQREEAARFAMLDALDLDAPNKNPGKEARP
jgi:hypothetical protein